MKRLRPSTPGLKHLAFFEALGEGSESSPTHRAATAGLLTLRLIDHWFLAGPSMVEPESVSVRSVRQAIMTIPANDPQREVLLGLVNTMQTLREVDLQPVLPRVFAYAGILERRGELAMAADVYESVVRLGSEEYDADLIIDSHMRLGYCHRYLGALPVAESAYVCAARIAKRVGEPARVLRSEIGLANVMIARGDLPKAEEMLTAAALESEQLGLGELHASALHSRAVVAQRRGHIDQAVCFAFDALRRTAIPGERDRMLGDVGAFLIVLERFDAARDALMVLEATATDEVVRLMAKVNLVTLGARSGDRALFDHWRASLAGAELPAESQANLMIESARGLRRFGEPEQATKLLRAALAFARDRGLNRTLFEAEALLHEREAVVNTQSGGMRAERHDPTAYVARELRQMAAALAA